MKILPLQTLEAPPLETFRREYLDRDLPVIIRGAMSGWPALSAWTPEYIRQKAGHRQCFMRPAPPASQFRPDPTAGFQPPVMGLLSEFIDSLEGKTPGRRLALLENLMPEVFPDLMADVEVPSYLGGKAPKEINLWWGQQGNVTPLHFDGYQNFLTQVSGRKHLFLISPGQFGDLYPYPMYSVFGHCFHADPEVPDDERFPRLRKVTAYAGELSPGDMVFIPFHWAHQVRTLETGLSVNFWWPGSLRHYLSWPMARLLVRFARIILMQRGGTPPEASPPPAGAAPGV